MATPPKPPKDGNPASPKPAARRAPRKTPAQPAARRTSAKAAKAAAEVKDTTAPAEAAPTPARKPRTPRTQAAAKPAAVVVAKRRYVRRAEKAVAKVVADVHVPAVPKALTGARAWSIGAVLVAAGAGLAAFLNRGRIAATLAPSGEGHVPTDLLSPGDNGLSKAAEERAPTAFRPDMDAPMTAAEREALRPATGPAPSLVSDRGGMNAQTGPAS